MFIKLVVGLHITHNKLISGSGKLPCSHIIVFVIKTLVTFCRTILNFTAVDENDIGKIAEKLDNKKDME